jgi:hypothetical protein
MGLGWKRGSLRWKGSGGVLGRRQKSGESLDGWSLVRVCGRWRTSGVFEAFGGVGSIGE